jgi:acetylornithine deacetylase
MDPLDLAQQLIRCHSLTSTSGSECIALLQQLLEQREFAVTKLCYRDAHGVEKQAISAVRYGRSASSQGIAFLSHSDVVSVDGWRTENQSGPFDAAVEGGRLWGRGACDMKGPIASALAAIDGIPVAQQVAPIYFFITSDEECGMVGAQLLVQQCPIYRKMIESKSVAIITEPTRLRVVNTHKGGCHFTVSSHGIAAHSSTNEGLNANWQLIPWLSLVREFASRIDSDPELRNHAFDPPTLNLNVVIKNQPTAHNITVGFASCAVFLRTMPDTAWQGLVDQLVKAARDMELDVSAISVLTPVHTPADCPFVQAALEIVEQEFPESMSYATDGCRYAELSNLIILGPGNIAQAHRCDEWIELEQLYAGAEIYRAFLQRYALLQHALVES